LARIGFVLCRHGVRFAGVVGHFSQLILPANRDSVALANAAEHSKIG
jgi:hypothetical protein